MRMEGRSPMTMWRSGKRENQELGVWNLLKDHIVVILFHILSNDPVKKPKINYLTSF